jgi:hypothetical protein
MSIGAALSLIATAAIAQAVAPPPASPDLAEPLREYSWLIGTWEAPPNRYLASTGDGSSLGLVGPVRISPNEDGNALVVAYSLEGSLAALAGYTAAINERLTFDAKTKRLHGNVVIRDSIPQGSGNTSNAAEGRSEYTLERVSENVWKGQARGNHRASRTSCSLTITREKNAVLVVSLTDRRDLSPANADITLRLTRAEPPSAAAR